LSGCCTIKPWMGDIAAEGKDWQSSAIPDTGFVGDAASALLRLREAPGAA